MEKEEEEEEVGRGWRRMVYWQQTQRTKRTLVTLSPRTLSKSNPDTATCLCLLGNVARTREAERAGMSPGL